MNDIFSISCTLLQKGFEIIKRSSLSESDDEEFKISELDNPNEPNLNDLENIIFVYEPLIDEIFDFDGWNIKDDGSKGWIKIVIDDPVFLIRKPEVISNGIYVPNNYPDNWINEHFSEFGYEDIKNLANELYKESLKYILKKQKYYDTSRGAFLNPLDEYPRTFDPSKAPYINIYLLTKWKTWSSYDSYNGEHDGGIEFEKFINI